MGGRLRVGWLRQPPRRRLAIVGTLTATLLFLAGLAADAQGKAFYDAHPFLSSIPQDTFKLVLVGTIGALLLDEWRVRVSNWPALRTRFIVVEHEVATTVALIARLLGRNDVLLEPGPTSYIGAADSFEADLRRCETLFTTASKQPTFDSAERRALDQSWRLALFSDGVPEGGDENLDPQVAALLRSLEDASAFASPGAGSRLARTVIHVRDAGNLVRTLRSSLRALSQPGTCSSQELFDIGLSYLDLANLVYFLSSSLEVIQYEVTYAAAFPFRT